MKKSILPLSLAWFIAIDCLANERQVDRVKAAAARVHISFATYTKELSTHLDELKKENPNRSALQAIVKETSLDYRYSPNVASSVIKRPGERRIVINDGWLFTMQELLLAYAVKAHIPELVNAPICADEYQQVLLKTVEANMKVSFNGSGHFRALPTFGTFVGANAKSRCFGIPADVRKRPIVAKRLEESEDAALRWLLRWKWQLQLDTVRTDLPAPTPHPVPLCWEPLPQSDSKGFAIAPGRDLPLAQPAISFHTQLFERICSKTAWSVSPPVHQARYQAVR